MALNGLRFPPSQPIKFYPTVVEIDNAYHTYSMDDYAMQLIQPEHMRRNAFRGNQNYYYTKAQNDQWITVIFEYALGNVNSFYMRIFDKDGAFTNVSPSAYMSKYTIAGNVWNNNGVDVPLKYVQYKFKVSDIIGLAQGYYQLVVGAEFLDGQDIVYRSEWLDIKNTHKNTILFDYFNSINDFDIYFAANPILQLRFAAYRRMAAPQFEDVTYRNQNVDLKLLSSRAYRMFDLFVGFNGGISDFHVDKLRYATQCDTLKIDNKRVIKSDSGEFSVTPIANYPLYKVEMQIEEYDPKEAGTFFEDNGLFLFRTGTYPYVVSSLVLSEGATDYDFLAPYTNNTKEILTAEKETEFIDELNAHLLTIPLTGSFVKKGVALYFQKDSDILTISDVKTLNGVTIINFATTPTDTSQLITIVQGTGVSALSLYRNSATTENMFEVQQYSGDFSQLMDVDTVSPADYDDYRIYLYYNDLVTELQVENTGQTITSVDGVSPVIATSIIFIGGQIGLFSTDYAINSAQTLETLNCEDMGVSTISDSAFNIVNTGDWGNLLNVSVSINDLDDANQDKFYLNYYKVYDEYSLAEGTLNTSNSSGFSSPTVLSLTERNAMIADSYTIST